MPAPTPDQLGLLRVLDALANGSSVAPIMDEQELNYPVHFEPDADPDSSTHVAILRDTALN